MRRSRLIVILILLVTAYFYWKSRNAIKKTKIINLIEFIEKNNKMLGRHSMSYRSGQFILYFEDLDSINVNLGEKKNFDQNIVISQIVVQNVPSKLNKDSVLAFASKFVNFVHELTTEYDVVGFTNYEPKQNKECTFYMYGPNTRLYKWRPGYQPNYDFPKLKIKYDYRGWTFISYDQLELK